MRIRVRPAAAVVIAMAAILLSGCAPAEPVITPEPSPRSSPVFASDEEALAAATEAYAEYVKISDEIASEGGSQPDRLSTVVDAEWLSKEVASFHKLASSGRHQTGNTSFRITRLQSINDDGSGHATVAAYVCLDVSDTRFLDATNADVTPIDRETRIGIEANFRSGDQPGSDLVLTGNEPWVGAGVC